MWVLPDGIGKWYMGREIAHTMSVVHADWLERPQRVQEEGAHPRACSPMWMCAPGT